MMDIHGKYNEYQEFIRRLKANPEDQKHLKRINNIINQRQLVSCMNDTKWIKLLDAVDCLSFPPAFIAKCLTDDKDEIKEQNFIMQIPCYLGNWQPFYKEAMPIFVNIEYLLVKPLLSKYQGKLIEDIILNQCDKFRIILESLNIRFDQDTDTFKIYAYQ